MEPEMDIENLLEDAVCQVGGLDWDSPASVAAIQRRMAAIRPHCAALIEGFSGGELFDFEKAICEGFEALDYKPSAREAFRNFVSCLRGGIEIEPTAIAC
jgi:hypothetical protein